VKVLWGKSGTAGAEGGAGRPFAADGRPTRHAGHGISLRIRKLIKEAFGWTKAVAGRCKLRHRGLPKVARQFTLAMAAYNLARQPKLLAVTA
jgi:hypothetical protein